MGAKYSYLDAEKSTWLDHLIVYDGSVREFCLPMIEVHFPLESEILLASKARELGGLTYSHWFLCNSGQSVFLEFKGDDIYTATVGINSNPRSDFAIEKTDTVTKELHQRMHHVIGMKNYSLCLRNCEHVANYVFRERWMSSQMDEEGILMNYFKSHILEESLKKVNTFPSTLRPHVFNSGKEKLYSFIETKYEPTNFDYFLDHDEESYNILVVGPTGAGKSRLINLFFNQKICDSRAGHASVTKEICFIRGKGNILDYNTWKFMARRIVVADTVGLCDTDWTDEQTFNLIKGRVTSNLKFIDAVFMVFKADRLLKEHIKPMKMVMDWLGYSKGDNHMKFMFVATHAENLEPKEINRMKGEAVKLLNLKVTHIGDFKDDAGKIRPLEALVYTGFPNELYLNDEGKAKVKESWNNLKLLLGLHPGEKLDAPKVSWRGYFEGRLGVPNLNVSCVIL